MNRRIRKSSRRARTGITLIEVLMSMFILAVGLLGIASLLPIGQRQIELADQQDRAAIIGQNAFRTFRTRGYTSPAAWMTDAGVSMSTSTTLSGPIILDPLLIDNWGNAMSGVPFSGTAVLTRFSVKPDPKSTATLAPPPGPSNNALKAMAEAIFVARDDLILKFGDTPEDSSTIGLDLNARRDFEGRYSWMAMIAPTYYPGNNANWTPQFEMPCELSIIVFNRRPYQGASVTDVQFDSDTIGGQNIPRERAVNVTAFDGSGIGGGDITIQDTANPYNLLVKPGEYLLLVSNGGSNNKKYARWYKILAAEDYNPAGGENERTITLSGADWTFGAATAILFDGAVAVYSKSTKLEGPSRMN